MSINYCEKERVFTLQTQNATYQMIVDSMVICCTAITGQKIERQNLSYCIQPQDRGFAANPPDAAGDRDTFPGHAAPGVLHLRCGGFPGELSGCARQKRRCGGGSEIWSYRIYPGKSR